MIFNKKNIARTMVKGKHSKLRPKSTNAPGSISLPINASAFIDISIQPQMQQKYNDVPFQTPSLLGASVEQIENETSTHNSHRSPSTDLGASVDDTSSRSRSRGLSVGLQTPVDPSDRLRITPIGERKHVFGLQIKMFWFDECGIKFVPIGGHGDFINNKSKFTSKYGDDSSSQPEFDPYAWTEAIGGMETTRTHVYGFGTRVPATALLTGTHNNVATSESSCGLINSNVNSLAIALKEKVKNLSKNLDKIREEIHREIHEEIKNAMAESMTEFMARIETMIMSNVRSKQGGVRPLS
ncbi:Uncharacterized protein TCM_038913 [Theobroma cacao]|uniref:Uncharacterized protein n=1 Tax=Theobroma cacao TaxID=3641 RepID=A0A061GPM8_THECC|nr:Uncharacterized protein TCM_038913 [Theobroma cacao]